MSVWIIWICGAEGLWGGRRGRRNWTLLRESKSLSSRILEKWFRWYIFLKVINFRNVFMATIYTDAINQQSNYGERVVKGVSLRLTVKKLYYQPDIGSSKPTLLTQYPRAHKWRPQKHFPSLSYRAKRRVESLPLQTTHQTTHRILRWNRKNHMYMICLECKKGIHDENPSKTEPSRIQ